MGVELGYSRLSQLVAALGPQFGNDAGVAVRVMSHAAGLQTGTSVVLEPSQYGQQIDAIALGVSPQFDTQSGLVGLRVLVVSSAASIKTLIAAAEALVRTAIPPGAVQITFPPAANSAKGWALETPWQKNQTPRLDTFVPASAWSRSGGVQLVELSGRPGGGLVIPPGEGAIVFALFAGLYDAALTPDVLVENERATLGLSVAGGLLSSSQSSLGSAAPTLVTPDADKAGAPPADAGAGAGRAWPRVDARYKGPDK